MDASQLDQFESDGFVVLPNAMSDEACLDLQRHVTEIVDQFHVDETTAATVFSTTDQSHAQDQYFFDSANRTSFFFESGAFDTEGRLIRPMVESLNKLGHAMHDLDPVFDQFSRQAWMAQATEAIGMRQPLLLQSMYIFKPPRIGGEVTPHTDHTFLWTDPPSVVGFWFAIDDATIENGCLWALPGSHRIPAKSRFRRSADGTGMTEVFNDEPYPQANAQPLEVERGTVVILHGLLAHWSQANTSPYPRHAYTMHIIDGAAHYPDDNWLQRSDELPLRGF